MTSNDFLWVFAGPPFLSFSTSSTKLQSPSIMTSSHLKSANRSKTEVEKIVGSSLFGAYKFAKVNCFPFVIPQGRSMFSKFER